MAPARECNITTAIENRLNIALTSIRIPDFALLILAPTSTVACSGFTALVSPFVLKNEVLPGFPWVPRSSVFRIEVQAAAEEVDGGLEVLPVPVAARPALDGHDLAVEAFGRAVGDPMPAKGQDVVQMPGEHLPDLASGSGLTSSPRSASVS